MLIAAGTLLEGKYRVERLIGAGGMGSVWVAEHTLLKRPVALKVLENAGQRDPTAVQRFMREAQTAARLRSDHIVDVLDVGRFDDGTPFLVMELLEGETLAQRIRARGKLAAGEAADFADQLLEGLGAAHAAGVIHRDIKPDNCFLTMKNGRIHLKLLDFGISKVTQTNDEGAPELRMTKTGVVMGTPYYMAPEQARGAKDIDHRCDLYAVGAILYECVAGRVPFEAESVNELLFKIVLEPLVPPHTYAPDLAADFEALIVRAMGRQAGDRFQTAQAFRDALSLFLPPPSRLPSSDGIGRVVVRPSHPDAFEDTREAMSGIGKTTPVDSTATPRPGAQLANGGTGAHAVSAAPERSRGSSARLWIVAGSILVVGGVAAMAWPGNKPVPAIASGGSVAPIASDPPRARAVESAIAAEKIAAPIASASATPSATPSAIVSVATSAATSGPTKSPPTLATAAHPMAPHSATAPAPSMASTTPPKSTLPTSPTSPRTIDTTL
jgi:serine/threonine-protein kinase